MTIPQIDDQQALDYLLRFLSIEGISGQEERIGKAIVEALTELGVPARDMAFDQAHQRIPLPTESGNLIVNLPGTEPNLPRRLFLAHRDTVALAAGARPILQGDRIIAESATALGADDRTGVACLVYLASLLLAGGLKHPPLTLLFTVREETGLWGARSLDPARLQSPEFAFNVDGSSPSLFVVGAVGVAYWDAEITGRSAHAGVAPEQGVSAALAAARALHDVAADGWFGRIRQEEGQGTANVGTISGRNRTPVGGSTNVVTDYTLVEGEARSHDEEFLARILDSYQNAFRRAADATQNEKGDKAVLEFRSQTVSYPFRLSPDAALIRFAGERARLIGLQPELKVTDGALDANWLARHGIPTLTFGAGQREVHTTREYVDVPDFLQACRLATTLAQA